MKKVKFNSRMELDWLSNWKIVQTAWKQLGVEKVVAVEKLIKGKFQVCYKFKAFPTIRSYNYFYL